MLEDSHQAFLADLRKYLDGLPGELVGAACAEYTENAMQVGPHGREFLRQLGRDGWIGVGWPADAGGQGRSPVEDWLYREELYYRRLPSGLLTVSSVGPVLIDVGTPAQKAAYLPRILAGELDFAIGYSEPDAGTDLAALRTRAETDGDELVVNGQKIWTTGAQVATHIWLAVRTGAPDSRHRGITVLIAPMDTAGISIRPIYTQAGEQTNEVFLDNVRVPRENVVGEIDGGWSVVTRQLNYERLFCHNEARREFDYAVEWADGAGRLDGDDAGSVLTRLQLAEMAADIEVTRLMSMRAAWMLSRHEMPVAEVSMLKVWWSELRQRVCGKSMELMGEQAQLGYGGADAPGGGHLERGLRTSTVWRFGAGTNEIQRDLIARVGLGMPK
jgi:3-oxocholest-4-en-26-oyl-CoA dehydrogenase alpha subunit